jgi:hypothetical protein
MNQCSNCFFRLLLTTLFCLLSACGGGDSQTRIRFVNAIVDSAPVDTSLDSRLIGSFSFRQASADFALNEGVIALKLAQANNSATFSPTVQITIKVNVIRK